MLATLHPPAELSAAVIEALRRASESALGGRSVLSAAIGAPALASDALRDALVAAGRRAGLQQIEIVDEHLAAARAAEHELPAALADARTLGVYDLGARAFSFGVLRRADGADGGGGGFDGGGGGGGGWEVAAARREALLGSEALDDALVDHLVDTFRDAEGIDLTADHLALQRLHEAAELAKGELCAAPSARVSLPFISADAAGPKHLELTISQAAFGRLASPTLDATLPLCADALADAGVAPAELDAVLVVGGAARAPALCAAVAGFFGREPIRPERPEEAVALGAALYAAEFQERKFSGG